MLNLRSKMRSKIFKWHSPINQLGLRSLKTLRSFKTYCDKTRFNFERNEGLKKSLKTLRSFKTYCDNNNNNNKKSSKTLQTYSGKKINNHRKSDHPFKYKNKI